MNMYYFCNLERRKDKYIYLKIIYGMKPNLLNMANTIYFYPALPFHLLDLPSPAQCCSGNMESLGLLWICSCLCTCCFFSASDPQRTPTPHGKPSPAGGTENLHDALRENKSLSLSCCHSSVLIITLLLCFYSVYMLGSISLAGLWDQCRRVTITWGPPVLKTRCSWGLEWPTENLKRKKPAWP